MIAAYFRFLTILLLRSARLHVAEARIPPLRLTLLLVAALFNAHAAQAADERPTVQMTVDYGDGAELRLTGIAWQLDQTVLDVLEAAATHPHGVTHKKRGAGANTFVSQIGDLKNEGGGRKSRNWIYRVNGKQADVSVGAYDLKAGDVILWKFEVPDYND